ncbi:hypothetical protein ON05_032645 (plasmid) [Acaryochloris sp. CCMEE 5410]|nr:hypothetical protein ON05_032645 [Acaryochloris sp. CCMEE 5410]
MNHEKASEVEPMTNIAPIDKPLKKEVLSNIISALPVIALRLGMVGWGCWLMVDGLVGPAPITGRLRLEAPVFQPVIELSKAIIHNPLANDALHHGSLVCFLGGAGVIGLRHVAFLWDTYRGKNGKDDGR